MALYCISYDLVKPERDYEKIKTFLEEYGNHFHALQSVWFIESTEKASEIRDKISVLTDEDDKIFVIEIKKHWGAINLQTLPQWMRT